MKQSDVNIFLGLLRALPVNDNGNFYYRTISHRALCSIEETLNRNVTEKDVEPLSERKNGD